MLRKDYIMRMVEQIGRAVAEIVLRRKAKETAEVERLMEQASTEYLGLAFEFLKSQPVGQLKMLFALDGELDVGKCIVAGELFGQAAAQLQGSGDSAQAAAMLMKSQDLYIEAYRVLPDRERGIYAQKIVAMLERLPDREVSDQARLKFVDVYEAAGKFDSAEDLLFELVEEGVAGALELGLRLYDRLLRRKDEELEQGGLPREEVEQSLRELERTRAASA
jgi:hypothetical protein